MEERLIVLFGFAAALSVMTLIFFFVSAIIKRPIAVVAAGVCGTIATILWKMELSLLVQKGFEDPLLPTALKLAPWGIVGGIGILAIGIIWSVLERRGNAKQATTPDNMDPVAEIRAIQKERARLETRLRETIQRSLAQG